MVVTPLKVEISPEVLDNIDIPKDTEVQNEECQVLEEWLSTIQSGNTRKSYRYGVKRFVMWYGKSVEAILNERKENLTQREKENLIDFKNRSTRFEKLIEKFHRWLIEEKKMAINTARTQCLGIMQLFRYYNMGVVLRSGSPVSQTVISTGDFVLLPEHVRAMFHVAKDLRSKLLVSLGNDLAWRISDVLSIQRDELPNLEQETPIVWLRVTKKEKQASKACLSETTVKLLREYLFAFPTKNPYLFNANGNGIISEETVNARLRDLARDSDIELGNNSLHWHCFRKMCISAAKNLGIDGDITKLMVGKSVKKDMLTYMDGIDVKTAFLKIQAVTGLKIVGEPTTEEKDSWLKEIQVLGAKYDMLLETLETVVTRLNDCGKDVNELAKILSQDKNVTKTEKELLRRIHDKKRSITRDLRHIAESKPDTDTTEDTA